MRTTDTISITAPLERVFEAARQVERWPQILSHYRWVRMLERRPDGGRVEMAAWRPFGSARWPTWWVSEMTVEPAAHVIRYRHVGGLTTGMDVRWILRERRAPAEPHSVEVELVHEWAGPPWPLIGGLAAALVIGPVFVHGIASRTLAGLKRHAEAA
ncbi:MAG TPA: SRPBCC family protein [Gemmatimonadales bacterium]|nr:SRPBCC family protein [Gemmatimonadales bacterium]